MRDILVELRAWWQQRTPFALATVVDVRKSAPRQPGAAMAITPGGTVAGSVSGGCVEGAVYELGQRVLATGRPEFASYGYSDDEAFAVGLTCGGEIDLFVERVDAGAQPAFGRLVEAIAAEEPVAVATVVGVPGDGDGQGPLGRKLVVGEDWVEGSCGVEGLDVAVTADARGMLGQGLTGVRHYGPSGQRRRDDVRVFVSSFAPRPRMYVFGAIDYAAAVVRVGALLGYHVTVCDAREAFVTRKRFPEAHEVVVEWPHRFLRRAQVDQRSVLCVLTHDPKFDVPLLEVALRGPAAYIGAMGSRRTCAERLDRLRERGLTGEELARLRAPIGLDLGSRTPEETAVSIAAEIIQRRWGGSGLPLAETQGRIHGAGAAAAVSAPAAPAAPPA